jgi:hypothetical protein
MKVPTKLVPREKVNCEQELSRADKVLAEMEMFKKELVSLKKRCLDEELYIKAKKKEEYEYYCRKLKEIDIVVTNLEIIRLKLNDTNLEINRSRGTFTKGVSILENKRVMRRKKENQKINNRKAFQRNVESLKNFLSKYSDLNFDDVFSIDEQKVPVPANHFVRNRQDKDPERHDSHDSVSRDEESEPEDGDLCVHSTGDHASQVSDDDSQESVVVINENQDSSVPNRSTSKPKYQHLKIERTINIKRKIKIGQLKSLNFDKKDKKSLELLTSLMSADATLEKVIKSKCSEWDLEVREALLFQTCDGLGDTAEVEDEVHLEIRDELEDPAKDDNQDSNNNVVKKKLKKDYKKSIKG